MNTKASRNVKPTQPAELRRKAEDRLRASEARSVEIASVADARAVVHELQVHQIELEMQNEEFQRARMDAEEASEKYYDLFDFAPTGHFLWDHDGRILEVNLAGAALLGLDRSAVSQKRFRQFVAAEFRRAFTDFLVRVLATDAKQTCEVTLQRDGSLVSVLIEGIAAQDRQGPQRFCRAAVIDISQQKRADELAAANQSLESEVAARQKAQEALRESQEQLRWHVESTPLAVIEWGPDFHIARWSGEAERIFGWRAEEVLGKHWDEFRFIYEEDFERVAQVGAGLRNGTRPRSVCCNRNYRKDGVIIHCEWYNSALLDASGELRSILSLVLDVTERHHAEEARRESQERLVLALNGGQIGMFAWNVLTGEVLWTSYTDLLWGYAPTTAPAAAATTQHSYRDFADRVHPDDLPWLEKRLHDCMAERRLFEAEYRVVWPDGSLHWVYDRGQFYYDATGRPVRMLGTVMDLTERKRAEEALRESEERMQMALEVSRSFVFEWEPTTDRVLHSDSRARVLGVSGDELRRDTGQNFFRRIHPEDRERIVQILGKLNPSADTYRTEYRVIRDAFTTTVLEESARGFFDTDGKLRRLVGVVTDITDRKRAEERTRLLSEVTAQLLANDQPQRMVESLCRRVMDDLGCHVFFNFLVDEQQQRLRLNACAGISNEAARQIEWLDYGTAVCGCAARDGSRIVAEHVQTTPDPRTDLVRSFGVQAYACHPLMNQGQAIGTLSFGSRGKLTFTEDELGLMKAVADHVAIAMQRIRLSESLQEHARAAEAANIAKSQFLANMSHELRTPMNAILGMIDVALPKSTDPIAQDCLQTAKGSADLLLALLNDLLDSAKIESGKLELEMAPFSLRRLLNQITQVLSARASEKGLCFSCRMPEGMPDAVIGDRMRLQQVLLNLAGNANKFTEEGEVEISVRSLTQDGEACLEFAVRDTGIGIPPSSLELIFQPFAQADPSMARRFGGTGLGLTICKNLVEMMGGRIWVESQVGHGSTFYFTLRLPLAKELPSDFEPPVAVTTAACVPLRILLAEDNPANQKLATYVLHDRGHLVEIAGDGQEAVALTEQNCYDVILMDVQMPGMNGLEATAAIRNREGGRRRVPIIAMTAHAAKGDRERCLAAGMDGYLSKPIDGQEMISLAETLAARSQ